MAVMTPAALLSERRDDNMRAVAEKVDIYVCAMNVTIRSSIGNTA